MATSTCRETARIYQFPARARTGTDDQRGTERQGAELVSMRIADVAMGGSWYHEAAFRESERALKR